MNRNTFSFLYSSLVLVFIASSLFAQIPTGYYDAADGLTGDPLKLALHNIIKGHTEFPYTSSSTDTWDVLKDADKDPNNTDNVIGIYSNFSMNAAQEYNSGSGWNREHVWAKSRGDFGTTQGAGTDLHHLRAADISTNSARNNRNFDNATIQYIDGDGSTDSYTSDTDWVWEPRDEMKGDVARMIFYMATRYEGDTDEPDLELTETLLTNTDKSPLHAKLSILLEWHLADPVTTAEQNRNDIIYSYQNNRNPYIDHPEYVCMIYSCQGVNNAPVFTSSPILTAAEAEVYNYDITTTDVNGDNMTISATTLPAWLTLTSTGNGTATLFGTPTSGDIGDLDVELNVFDGKDNTSQGFTIVVSGVTSINDSHENEILINIYPNPSAGVIKVEGTIQDNGDIYLEVFDVKGKSVYSAKLKVRNNKIKKRIDLGSLENGIYTIKTRSKSGYQCAKKISINK